MHREFNARALNYPDSVRSKEVLSTEIVEYLTTRCINHIMNTYKALGAFQKEQGLE